MFSQSEALHGYHGNQNQTLYRFWIFGIWAFIWYITLHNWVLASGWKRLAKIWAPNTRPLLNFLFWYVCVAQRVKKKKKKKNFCQIRGLKELIFLSNLRLLKLKLDLMLGIRTELFFNFEPLKCKFSRNLSFQANVGSWGTKKFWNGGFREGSGGRERGVLRVAHNCTPFSAEYPPPGLQGPTW